MISLEQFRKLLGKSGENMNDIQIEHIREAQYQIAEIVFKMWQEKRKSAKLEKP
jgi:hypothetical protein